MPMREAERRKIFARGTEFPVWAKVPLSLCGTKELHHNSGAEREGGSTHKRKHLPSSEIGSPHLAEAVRRTRRPPSRGQRGTASACCSELEGALQA